MQRSPWRSLIAGLLCCAALCFSCKDKAAGYYQEGLQLFNSGDMPGALAAYEKALKIKPNDAEILYAAGWANLSMGETQKATVFFARAIKENPHYWGGYKGMANVYAITDQSAKAEEFYNEALKRDPKNASIHSNVGDFYRREKKSKEAIKHYQMAIDLMPGVADPQNGLIGLALDEARYDDVIRLGEDALKKEYRQQNLKWQTYYYLCIAHIEKAKAAKMPDVRAMEVQEANNSLKEAKRLSKNNKAFDGLEKELSALKPAAKP